MPRIRITQSIAGLRFSYAPGEEIDVDGETASNWVASGVAELVTARHIETPERSQVPVEKRRPGRPRKNPVV